MTGLEKLIERARRDQPAPRYRCNSVPVVHDMSFDCPAEILVGLEDRRRRGIQSYGIALRSHNGRDNLADAVQELLDAAQYIHAAKLTDGISPEEAGETRRQALHGMLLDYKTLMHEGEPVHNWPL